MPSQPPLPATGSVPPPGGQPGNPSGIPPSDAGKQTFDFAADATKQLITVATGVVAATAIFSKNLDNTARYVALASWTVLMISVIFGLLALFFMTGNLNNATRHGVAPTLSKTIQHSSLLQLGNFLLGIILVMWFGFLAAGAKSPPDIKPLTINCVVANPPAPVIVQVPTPFSPPTSRATERSSKKASPR